MASNFNRLISIQYLRGIAAMMVLVFHVAGPAQRVWPVPDFSGFLESGVDIFLVISGFVMWVSTANKELNPVQFYTKRALRVLPLYWLLTAFIVLVSLTAPSLLKSARFDRWHTLASLLFIPARHPVTGELRPVLVPGWTLNLEMSFYLFFGLALLLPKPWRIGVVVTVLLGLTIAGWLLAPSGILGFYTTSLMLEFGVGSLLGLGYVKGYCLPKFWARVALISGFSLLVFSAFYPNVDRLVAFGLPAAVIVAGATSLSPPKWAILKLLGDASYSIYLVHGIVLSALATILLRLFPQFQGPFAAVIFYLAAVPIASLAGILIYYWVELKLVPRGLN